MRNGTLENLTDADDHDFDTLAHWMEVVSEELTRLESKGFRFFIQSKEGKGLRGVVIRRPEPFKGSE